MTPLHSELQQITTDFVSAVLQVLGSAPLSELAQHAERAGAVPAVPAAVSRRPARPLPPATVSRYKPAIASQPEMGRRHRASAEEVRRHKELALATAKRLPPGFSKGDLMKRAGSKIDLGRALGLLVDEGHLTRKGERRNTRYWLR